MKSASEAELGHEAWKLYEYITRHFIATVDFLFSAFLGFPLVVVIFSSVNFNAFI